MTDVFFRTEVLKGSASNYLLSRTHFVIRRGIPPPFTFFFLDRLIVVSVG